MAGVAKVVRLIGSSPEIFAKAADAAVQEAAKTIRGIEGMDILRTSAVVRDGAIAEYHTEVRITFRIERS